MDYSSTDYAVTSYFGATSQSTSRLENVTVSYTRSVDHSPYFEVVIRAYSHGFFSPVHDFDLFFDDIIIPENNRAFISSNLAEGMHDTAFSKLNISGNMGIFADDALVLRLFLRHYNNKCSLIARPRANSTSKLISQLLTNRSRIWSQVSYK